MVEKETNEKKLKADLWSPVLKLFMEKAKDYLSLGE